MAIKISNYSFHPIAFGLTLPMFLIHPVRIAGLLFILLAINPILSFTQTIIKGYVKDAFTHSNLNGVSIKLKDLGGTSLSAVSDSLGRFRFENVAPGRYQITAEAVNYQEARILDYLAGRVNIPITIDMEPRIADLPEIVITDRRTGAYLHPLSNRLLVTRELTERLPAAFFDPARLFTNQAGISSLNDAANHLIIRGNNPLFVKWMIHGTEILNPNHLSNAGTFSDQASASGGGVNMISASVLDNTYLVKSPYPAGVGNALAGIVDLNLRQGRIDKLAVEGQISLLGMEAGIEGPISSIQGSSFIMRYRYSTVGLLSELGAQFGDENINYQDLMGHLHFPTAKNDWSIYFFTGNNHNLYAGIKDSTQLTIDKEKQNIEFSGGQTIAGLSHEMRITNKNRWVNDLIYSRLKTSRSFGLVSTETLPNQNHLNQEKWSLHSRFVTAIHNNGVLTSGLQVQANKDEARYQGGSVAPNANCCPDPYYSIQPYINYSIQIKKLTWQTGIHSMVSSGASLEPRIQLLYRLKPDQSIQLHAGKYSQLPGPISYYPKAFRDPIPSYQFQLGYQKSKEMFEWSSSIYYQYHLNVPAGGEHYSLINENPFQIGEIGQADSKGKVYGLETTLATHFGDWRWTGNLSLFNSKLITPSGKIYSSRFDQKYLLHSGIGREWVKEKSNAKRLIGFSTQLFYGGALRDTPIDKDKSLLLKFQVYEWDKLNTIKRPDLYRLDFRIYKRKFYKNMNTLLALDIQNLTGKQNFAFSYFDFVQKQTVVNYQLGILPNLSFTIEY